MIATTEKRRKELRGGNSLASRLLFIKENKTSAEEKFETTEIYFKLIFT